MTPDTKRAESIPMSQSKATDDFGKSAVDTTGRRPAVATDRVLTALTSDAAMWA
jgi:hypothetical protein